MHTDRAPEPRGGRLQSATAASLQPFWSLGRKKRWDYWAVTTDSYVFSITYANLDYLGLVVAQFLRRNRPLAGAPGLSAAGPGLCAA